MENIVCMILWGRSKCGMLRTNIYGGWSCLVMKNHYLCVTMNHRSDGESLVALDTQSWIGRNEIISI